MKKSSARRPSPALIVSFVALFVALGGSAYAVSSTLPDNSVGTPQLRNGAVTTVKIANRAVTGAKLDLEGVTVPNAHNATNLTGAGWGLVDAGGASPVLSDKHDATVTSMGAGTGQWCITVSGASSETTPIVLTSELGNDSTFINPNIGETAGVEWDQSGADFTCPKGEYAVVTFLVTKGTSTGFHTVHQDASFSFFVP